MIIPFESNAEISIGGGPLQYQYRPVEIYVRLAPPTMSDGVPRGSEHQIDNRSFHGEVGERAMIIEPPDGRCT